MSPEPRKTSARLDVSLALISAASIGFEVTLVRVLAIVGWEAVAAQAVGIAMIGVGAAGTALSIWPQNELSDHSFRARYGAATSTFSLSLPVVTAVAASVAYEPFFTDRLGSSMLALAARVLLLAVPFYLAAFALGLALVHRADSTPRLYGANLLGAGAGALSFPILSSNLYPSRLVLVYAGVAAVGWIAGANHGRRTRLLAAIVACALIAAMARLDVPKLRMSAYKDLSAAALATGAIVEHRSHGPQGLLTTVRSPALHVAPGLSLQADAVPPEQIGLFLNGEGYGAVDRHTAGSDRPRYLRFRPEAVAFELGPARKVLVAGSGGGQLVHLARSYGAGAVVAVESVGAVPDLLNGQLREFSGHIYDSPGVRLHVDAIRGFLATAPDSFDVILLPMAQGFQKSVMGLASLQENEIYTREGISDAAKRLAPGGRLVLGAWLQEPPRDALKLLCLAFDVAARSDGASGAPPPAASPSSAAQSDAAPTDARPAAAGSTSRDGASVSSLRVLAFRTWGQLTVLLVRGNEPNSMASRDGEGVGSDANTSVPTVGRSQSGDANVGPDGTGIDAFRETLRRLAFDPVWAPGATSEDANRFNVQDRPLLFEASIRLAKDPEAYLGDLAPLDLSVPTDDRPFFGHFWKPAHVLGVDLSADRATLEWGTLLGASSLAVVVFLSVLLILAPLAASAARRRVLQTSGVGRTTIGFMAIGLGYMAVELLFLSRLTLVLHQPALAVSVALAGFLGFSGLGSLTAGVLIRRTSVRPEPFDKLRTQPVPFGAIALKAQTNEGRWSGGPAAGQIAAAAGIGVALLTPALLWALHDGFASLASLEIAPRMAACLGLVAPLAFLMGMPFPSAVSQIHGAQSPALLPWALAMNGTMSAVAPSLFALVAPWTGHQVLAWLAAALYLTAAVAFRSPVIRNRASGP